ncbi:hypothetical protein BO86DRAFT_402535 [Aspergillus japonicus CBS 114.51]|uniref:Uncharacterized protein n=1 Tax=Aspergillus japonicus CBS 114.51 TaxID=1448312 RepID=A0A8T8WS89_ASPJA|nr:hypothetical protein BO86DRAFT_402535 [Aspergillus japonicus CBS 114.51]RAH78718.1 hypothetical protein BO86DRAFT_402535 [Aspergillus japonicus CBS 114.51]
MISLPQQHTPPPSASSLPLLSQDQLTTAANPNPNPTPDAAPPPQHHHQGQQLHLQYPRLTIQYCTQCKWMLRAAYTNPQSRTTSVAQPQNRTNLNPLRPRRALRGKHGKQFAQELLSTFATQLGEVALQPATGGVFTVTLYHRPGGSSSSSASGPEAEGTEDPDEAGQEETVTESVLWDRKRDGGFPEVKVLKSLVRNVVDPGRDLGHTDRALRKGRDQEQQQKQEGKEKCEDCQ